ncbi:MAG: acetate/propionate family kinase [Chromatiaceae bacterium]|nr:acetate/propionate family kinase [Chromatiaceae bacterium]
MTNAGILVLNAGSSSLKFAVFALSGDSDEGTVVLRGQISAIGSAALFRAWNRFRRSAAESESRAVADLATHQKAIEYALAWIGEKSDGMQLIAVGHRVVHGGPERSASALVSDALLHELDVLSLLAPHHQPHNLAAIRAVRAVAPDLPQVACFDTAFHAGQPEVARRLPLPAMYREMGLQRYGFHGLSYEYITSVVAEHNAGQLPERLIVAHLGNGASLCAISGGRSIATSMGFSTLDGLLMGTRSGSIDPGVLLHLMREEQMAEPDLSNLLYNQSGLLGVSGISSDMQVLLSSSERGAVEAVELFCYTLMRSIGSMAAALQGVDGIVFTGGIGEHAAQIRQTVCENLAWLGVDFDVAANTAGASLLTRAASRVRVWVIPTDEERIIARHAVRVVRTAGLAAGPAAEVEPPRD